MIVGNPSSFAIESEMTYVYPELSKRGLGFFVIHVDGKQYGIRSSTATLLACSLDAVKRRLVRRGTHDIPFAAEPDAVKIADAVCAACYLEDRQNEEFFGMSAESLRQALDAGQIIWAPDGDEAFDDSGHVLQIDQDHKVRIIAFRNLDSKEEMALTLKEIWLSSDEFYRTLDIWRERFEENWLRALETGESTSP